MTEAERFAEHLGFSVVYLDGFGYIQEEGEQGPVIEREATLEERTMWTEMQVISAELEALKKAISEAQPVAVALRFGADPRICLSTVFDTATEAQEYANRTVNGAELVQLYTLKGIK